MANKRVAVMDMVRRHLARLDAASKIVFGILLGLALLAIWQIFFVPHSASSLWTIPGIRPTSTPQIQLPPLLAVGMSLDYTGQKANLSRQQALLIASQLEPDAAVHAEHIETRYVLLNYPASSRLITHLDFRDVPVWLIWYRNIPLPPTSPSVDLTPFPLLYHDLYVFIDANTGHELLSLWR